MQARIVAIDNEGVVTIPPEILAILGLPHGGAVAFVVQDDGHVELRSPPFSLESVFGSVAALPNATPDLDAEIAAAIDAWVKERYPAP